MAAGPARALLVLALVLGGAAGAGAGADGEDLLTRLGRAAWEALESALGPQPLRAVAEFLSSTFWIISSGISAALSTLCGILGDLLAAAGVDGSAAMRAAAPGAAAVQRVLLWALAALALSGPGSRLQALVLPLLRGAQRCCFLGAFLWVAGSRQNPTVQAALLLALWVLRCLLASIGSPPAPEPRLEAAVRSLEWKVEELRRRQKWGGPRNREE